MAASVEAEEGHIQSAVLLATGLDAVLVEAIKELKAENVLLKEQLKEQNLALKRRLDTLERIIKRLAKGKEVEL
jgi:hypothetical protein